MEQEGASFKRDADRVNLPISSKITLAAATIISLIWILGAFALANAKCPEFASCLDLNEWGDFFSGAFAPLAFAWLVVAVVLQTRELREQRRELELTRREFRYNRHVLEAQASEAHRQATFIGVQTELLKANEQQRAFDNWVATLASRLRQYDHIWTFTNDLNGAKLLIRREDYSAHTDQDTVVSARRRISTALRAHEQEGVSLSNGGKAAYPRDFLLVYRALEQCRIAAKDLSLADKAKAEALELERFWREVRWLYHNCVEPHGVLLPPGEWYK